MTENAHTPRLIVAGNATRGPFTLSVSGSPITYAAANELVLKRYDDEGDLVGTLVLNTDYTLSATSRETGQAAATFTLELSEDVLAADESIIVERSTAKSSGFALPSTGGIFESAIDKITRIQQELTVAVGRRLEVDPLYAGSTTLPPAQAGYIVGWDDDGTGLQNYANVASAQTVVSADGNSHVLEAWFTGYGRGGDTLSYAGFWRDVTTATRVHLLRDRVGIGRGADATFNFNGSMGSILPTSTEGASWLLRDSDLLVISSIGRQAIAGIVRTSDQIQSPALGYGAAIGVSAALVNNQSGRTGWALYVDVQHESGVGASFGAEFAVKNKGADVTHNPYATNAGTFGIWLAGGGDATYGGAPTAPSMVAIAIGANSTTWNSGIVFQNGSLTSVGGLYNAITFAQNHNLRWDRPDNTTAARIYSSMTNTSTGASYRIVFADSGIQLVGTAAVNILELQHTASAVNGFRITNNTTGQPSLLSATGSDTNIDIMVTPKNDAVLIANRGDAGTNSVSSALRLRHAITGTPANGCGVALEFQQETTDNNFEIGAKLSAICTDVTATSEDFDLAVLLMAGGATASETIRFKSTKQTKFAAIAGDPSGLEDGDFWYNSSTNKFRGRAGGASVDLH